MFYERFGREGASTAQKQRFLRPFRPIDRSRARFELSNTRKNTVFYKLFDRPTDRPNRLIQRDIQKQRILHAFRSTDRSRVRYASKLRVLRAFRPRVRFALAKTTYFTTFSIDGPIESLSGFLWASLGISGALWASLGLSGALWAFLGFSGFYT